MRPRSIFRNFFSRRVRIESTAWITGSWDTRSPDLPRRGAIGKSTAAGSREGWTSARCCRFLNGSSPDDKVPCVLGGASRIVYR